MKGSICFKAWIISAAFIAILVFLTLFRFVFLSQYEIISLIPFSDNHENVKLSFVSSWGANDAKSAVISKLLSQFTADNPDVEVANNSVSDEDFLLKIKTDFASGNEPDLFAMKPGYNLYTFIERGMVADLTDTLGADSEWERSFDRSALYYVMINGRIYGLPIETVYLALFVNTDLFDEYNIQIPETYEQLKNAVVEFRKRGIIPIAYNALNEGSFIYQSIIAKIGGRREIEEAFINREISSCYAEAMKYMEELYGLRAFPDDCFNIDNKSKNQLFLSKKAAMIVHESGFIGEINKQPDIISAKEYVDEYGNRDTVITVGALPFPYIEGGKADPTSMVYGAGAGTFYISEATWNNPERKEAAIRLLRFLTDKQSATLFAEDAKMLSAVKIEPPNVYFSGLMKQGRLLLDTSKEIIRYPDSVMDRTIWEERIIKQFPYILEGGINEIQFGED